MWLDNGQFYPYLSWLFHWHCGNSVEPGRLEWHIWVDKHILPTNLIPGWRYMLTSILNMEFLPSADDRCWLVLSLVIAFFPSSVCPSVCSSVRPKRCSCCDSLRISAISLKFVGMMLSSMKQIAIQSGHALPIFAHSVELWNIRWKAWTRSEGRHYRSNSIRISTISVKFDGMMCSNMKPFAVKMTLLSQFLLVQWNFEISGIGED